MPSGCRGDGSARNRTSTTRKGKKDRELTTNATLTPLAATTSAPSRGPTARDRLKLTDCSASAAGRSRRDTIEGISACIVGAASALPTLVTSANDRSGHGVVSPTIVRPASATAGTSWKYWLAASNRRRSKRSAIDPVTGARRKTAAKEEKVTAPTQVAEPVRSKTRMAVAMSWNHVPMLDSVEVIT